MAKVMVVGVKTYSFNNDANQKVEGARVSYLTSIPSNKSNELGFLPLQSIVSLDVVNSLKEIPAIYDVNYDMVPGRNNKPEMIITGFEFLQSVDYLGLFE
mgnify:CR=1 FL=1